MNRAASVPSERTAGSRGGAPRELTRGVLLTAGVAAGIAREAERSLPEEACGFLIGPERDRLLVDELLPSPNVAEGKRAGRFRLSPAASRQAEARASGAGRALLGFYHSHPGEPALPSAVDELGAWAGYLYVIAAVREGRSRELRAFELDPATLRFRERPVRLLNLQPSDAREVLRAAG